MPRLLAPLLAPLVIALGFTLSACTLDVDFSDTTDASVTPGTAPPLSPERAATLLDGLRQAPRARPTDYQRKAFGSAWRDTDRNGCNQRDDVLLRDAVPGSTRVQQQGRCDHDVLAGTWRDPYSGRTLQLDDLKNPSQAQAVQIDHV
ncbi:hypothetical protein ACLM5J_03755 [Nocardioides sp. Bht2]|uniref:hypothetical protein n=1 Tax=Nocardioides sp. Bht2 TaxID=3392297 RepID=UPI0039B6E94C